MILQNWLSRAPTMPAKACCHLLACLTGIEAVLGELLDLLHHLLDRGADLRGDGVDREVEDKGQRAIGRGLHGGDDLVGVDEGKAAGENVDAAAASLDAGHLERAQLVGRLRRKADPEIAARIIAALLAIIGDRASGIGRPAEVGEEGIELAVHIGLSRWTQSRLPSASTARMRASQWRMTWGQRIRSRSPA
jgi:hypothetical protein